MTKFNLSVCRKWPCLDTLTVLSEIRLAFPTEFKKHSSLTADHKIRQRKKTF